MGVPSSSLETAADLAIVLTRGGPCGEGREHAIQAPAVFRCSVGEACREQMEKGQGVQAAEAEARACCTTGPCCLALFVCKCCTPFCGPERLPHGHTPKAQPLQTAHPGSVRLGA